MAKKKKEHILFDRMSRVKNTFNFKDMNRMDKNNEKDILIKTIRKK